MADLIELRKFLNDGVRDLVSVVARYYAGVESGRKFLAAFVPKLRKAELLREYHAKDGTNVPTFLIASICSSCNLHCKGCYARAEKMCHDLSTEGELSLDEWKHVFCEAGELGVSFILLAGGEPLIKRDVIEAAANVHGVAFPIFTNGLLIDDGYIELFDKSRNLIPVISIEGDARQTDERRGEGVSARIEDAMKRLNEKKILYAASITVTKENLDTVTDEGFVRELRKKGVGILFYIEYVPMGGKADELTLDEADNAKMTERAERLRRAMRDMAIRSFPGDEHETGGCLAAGRGFFHINPKGGAEPCPFSPHSRDNVRDGLLNAMRSDFFRRVREISCRGENEHIGGCTLHVLEDEVAALLR